MELITALQQFTILKNEIDLETFSMFIPIIYEVKRQDTTSLLFPPMLDTFEVKWRVKNPQGIIPTSYPYLIFGPWMDGRTKKLVMALHECKRAMDHDLYFERFNYDDYEAEMESIQPSSEFDMLEEIKPLIDRGDNDEVCLLERFSLDREMDAAAVAKRIITEARRIFREQKKIGRTLRKERAARTAKARKKPALVFDKPTPTD
jgi:hypothetical protein